MTFNVSEDIIYVGVDDPELTLFEGQYSVDNGVSYNSYLCVDKKIAVLDTVDSRKTEEWLANLQTALKGACPDYLVVSHVEPDHSASIPAFLKKYPSVTVVGNGKTFTLLQKFYGNIINNKLTVEEGDELNLGKHCLSFIFAPMVHWPEVMLSYDRTDGVLFSADAFGKFGTLAHGGEWLNEARRYYINIVGKYGAPVQAVLKKASALDVRAICPLHGPVLKENLGYYVGKYMTWSSYAPEEDGVLIAYASVYGNTASASRRLAEELEKLGVKTELFDLNRRDGAQAVANAFRFSKTVVASITYDGGIMPCAEAFINKLKMKNYCNRTVGFIQNGSWAPLSAKLMREKFESFKGIEILPETVTVNSAPDEACEEQIKRLALALSK